MPDLTVTDQLTNALKTAEANSQIKNQYANVASFDFSDGGVRFANSKEGQQLIKDLATGNSGLANANALMDLLALHLSPEVQEKLTQIVMQQLATNLTKDVPWKYILSRIAYTNTNQVDIRGNSKLFRQNSQPFDKLSDFNPELSNPLRQIDSKSQQIKPNIASKTFFMSQNDFKFAETLNASKLPTYSSIQPIILNEYQPAYTVTLVKKLKMLQEGVTNLVQGRIKYAI